jgi:CRISPR-associated protein Cas2
MVSDRVKALLIYDIPDDRLRARVADMCLDYGLHRIQYSAFFGEMSHNRQEEILQKIKRHAAKRPISVHVFPLCENDLARRASYIRAPEDGS